MKKIIALVCMITCIFGMTACSSEETYSAVELQKMEQAETIAETTYVPMLIMYSEGALKESFNDYTSEEIEFVFEAQSGLMMDGYAFKTALSSFESAKETIGEVVTIGEATSEIDGNTIVVTVPVTGALKNAEAEIIVSNDMFYKLESAALNEESTMGDLMTKAALNTLIGMGTVFIVLILISFIISLFGFIPKIQAKMAEGKKKKEETKEESIDNTIAQIVEKEDVSDDLELVAVIAAAIAASEGQTSTDGFVVRSIRKVNRRK